MNIVAILRETGPCHTQRPSVQNTQVVLPIVKLGILK